MSALVLATARSQIADYVQALVWVYVLIIFAYVISRMFFQLGGRIPYARWSSVVLEFLGAVSEPYLRVFRRLLPTFGPKEFSVIPPVKIDPMKLAGPSADGYVLERQHTLSSEFLAHDSFGNPQFDTKRTELFEVKNDS